MRRWRLFAVLIVAMVFASFIIGRDSTPSPDAAVEPPDAADLFMQRATVTQFDADGSLRYRLSAEEIRHFDANAITRLQKPRLTFHGADGPPWVASSNHGDIRHRDGGVMDGNEEIVSLHEAVVLESDEEEGRVRLTTESLDVYPERRFAETNRTVIIESNAGRTTAAGLVGDLSTGVLKLSSDASQRVHTIVLPEQFKRATQV